MRPSILLLAATLGAACSGAPQDPVDRLLYDLTRAVEERDAPAVGTRLAEGFRGQDGTTGADAVATIRRYLAAYERVSVTVFDVSRPDPTRVSFRVNFEGKPRNIGGLAGLLPSSAVYRFELQLTGEAPDLKVLEAAWSEWRPEAPR